MASKVKFQVSFTPIEDNTTQAGGSNMIAASECYGTLSGGGELDVTIDGTGGNNHGYDDGVVNYVQAATSSTTAISMTPPDIVAIKHTGYQWGSASALSTTANTTDFLSVFVNDGSADRWVGSLKSGEMMIVPLRGRTGYLVKVQSTDNDGDNGGNTIAAQYYSFT